ncbi:MFS general substrate transporter [Physcia stellaris]|nr:MFS general substrate transporter [Physcia stellaris]
MPSLQLNNPLVQNVIVGIILGLGPGIYVAVTLLGAGGGPANATQMVNTANSTLYAVFFLVGWFSGSVVTTFGPRLTLMMGTCGYPVFVGSLWYFTNTAHSWFPIAAGAFLGLCANLLWTAAAYISFTYSTEQNRGSYISMQWGLLSVFSTLGSLIAFGINFNASKLQVPISVYIVFIVLMASSFFIALLSIAAPSGVRRADGTSIAYYPHEGFWHELKNQRQLLRDWRLLAMFIPMLGSEVAIIVLSSLNSLYFNIRTRSLNSLMFNVMQIIGAVGIGILLDNRKVPSRRTRGFISILVVAIIIVAGWVGLTVWLYKNPLDPLNPPLIDWTDERFGGFFVLNLIFGINLVIYQVTVQWIIASFTNDPEHLARFAGLVKGVLAGGVAAAFGTEAAGLSQRNVVAYNFSVQAVGIGKQEDNISPAEKIHPEKVDSQP